MGQPPTPSTGTGSGATYVPFRKDPMTADTMDGNRIQLVRGRWQAQDSALLPYHRQVEENVRMIVGRHWDVWSPVLGQYVDVTRWMTEDERRWRQRPVINRILHWYILTHARLTENPPIVTFQPATADDLDAKLAEAMDTIFKTVWHDCDMLETIDRLMAVMIPGGQAYLKSGVDFSVGDSTYVPQQQQDGTYTLVEEKEGQITCDVLNGLECRGEWGGQPWHKKRWHIHRSFLSPTTVYEKWGQWVPPDTWQATNADGTGGYLTRLLFGSGYFGAAQAREYGANVQGMGNEAARKEGYVTVDEMWEAPSDAIPGYAAQGNSPGGRLLTVTQERVLYDGARPYAFRYTSPIRAFVFVNVPGRPMGTSPQEMMNPVQKTYNRGVAQILEHRNLVSNPILLIANQSGIQEGQVTNRPGSIIHHNGVPGVPDPIRYLEPAPLSADVWKTQEYLSETMDFLGNVTGSTGDAPTDDPSGIAIKQLRYNSDRFIGPTAKRAVGEFVRVIQDWIVILPSIWPQEKILAYSGEDDVVRTIAVYPEMWEGNVRIEPDMDSMIPEGRQERIQRVTTMYQLGAFGPPGSPQAAKALLDLTKFPHMNRLDISGGVTRITAQQAMSSIARGTQAADVPIYPWYNFDIWTGVFTEFMSGPEYLKLPEPVQAQFQWMLEKIQGAKVAAMVQQTKQMMPMLAMKAAVAGQVQSVAAANGPPPALPPGGGGPPGGGAPPPHGGGGGGGEHVASAGTHAGAPQAPSPLDTPAVEDR